VTFSQKLFHLENNNVRLFDKREGNMNLKWINAGPNGEDYREEAKANMAKGTDASRIEGRFALVITALILAIGIFSASHYQLSEGQMISVTVALATMCLIYVINLRTTSMEGDIIYVAGAIEWFGNKHLEQLVELKNKAYEDENSNVLGGD
jgi:hypothetical protein